MPLFQSKFGSGSSEDQFFNGVYDLSKIQVGDAFDGSLRRSVRWPGGIQESNVRSPSARKEKVLEHRSDQPDRPVFSAGDFYLSFQNVDIKGVMPKDVNKGSPFT